MNLCHALLLGFDDSKFRTFIFGCVIILIRLELSGVWF